MRNDSGVAGEGTSGRVVDIHFLGKCTMLLTNINSDWIFNASSGLLYKLLHPKMRKKGPA